MYENKEFLKCKLTNFYFFPWIRYGTTDCTTRRKLTKWGGTMASCFVVRTPCVGTSYCIWPVFLRISHVLMKPWL